MITKIQLCSAPLAVDSQPLPGCGAVVRFEGVVRGEENGVAIDGLHYEAYQPMAEQVMERILRELAAEHPCEQVIVQHRIGFVPVGEAAIIVEIQSKHRNEAFALLTHFMNRLKQDVPIWKKKAV
jgi:molybdopterin synthase catalytic subunit